MLLGKYPGCEKKKTFLPFFKFLKNFCPFNIISFNIYPKRLRHSMLEKTGCNKNIVWNLDTESLPPDILLSFGHLRSPNQGFHLNCLEKEISCFHQHYPRLISESGSADLLLGFLKCLFFHKLPSPLTKEILILGPDKDFPNNH